MTGFLQLIVIFIAAVNPAAVALSAAGQPRVARTAALGCAIAVALVVIAAAGADRFLDAFDIEPETFRIGAGVVLLANGVVVLVRARPAAFAPEGAWWQQAISPLAFPVLFGPAVAAAALSYGADDGPAKTIPAAVIAVVVAAAVYATGAARGRPALDGLARLLGALLVVVAVGLIVEGVRDV